MGSNEDTVFRPNSIPLSAVEVRGKQCPQSSLLRRRQPVGCPVDMHAGGSACPCLSAVNHDEYASAHYGGAHQNDRHAAKKVGHIPVPLKMSGCGMVLS
jgi:hypothetical protein